MSPNVNAGVAVTIPAKQRHVVNEHHPGHKWSNHSHPSHLGLGPSTAGLSTVMASDQGTLSTQPGVDTDTGPASIPNCKSGFLIESRLHISKPLRVWAKNWGFVSKHPEVLGFTCSPLHGKGRAGPKAWRLAFLSGGPRYAITI